MTIAIFDWRSPRRDQIRELLGGQPQVTAYAQISDVCDGEGLDWDWSARHFLYQCQ
jgi:hypothetical protein